MCPSDEPSSETVAVSYMTSIDIKDNLESGKYNYFKIESGETIPATDEETYMHTGLCMATLNVIGYMK